jgi:quinolinate synthase
MKHKIEIDPAIAERAGLAVKRMVELGSSRTD